MSDGDHWIRAICAAPDDDAPRLDYAQWLVQRGNPSGEFIRIQCELAGLEVDDLRYAQLDRQQRLLLDAHEQEWLGALWGRISDWTFSRGFLTAVVVDGSRYLATSDGSTLYRSPLNSEDLSDLLPLLPPTLSKLGLPGNHLGPEGVQALNVADHLTLLTTLDVSGFQAAGKATDWDPYEENVGSKGAKVLAASPSAARLRELDLSLNRIDDETALAMASSPYLKRLRRLTIHESDDQPYRSGRSWFANATIEALRASFGDRLSLCLECPGGTFTREERRKAVIKR